jgi:hypothetical protein
LNHQTCVFVGKEIWPWNLAENNTTIMVTGTVCLGVLYILKKRTPKEQTKSYCLLPSISDKIFRRIFVKFCLVYQSFITNWYTRDLL